VTSQLADTHLVELTSTATLVVSELVTNALRGAHHRLELDVCVGPDSLDIGVADDAPGELRVRAARSLATGGRGLPLIDAVVKSRHVVRDVGGKVVWCHLEPKRR
jgi:anti-sigma regulatory factor (Ser/Thr protein kinase)